MTIEEQAAMYEAGFKDLKSGGMGRRDWSNAEAVEDHMALEVLYTYDEGELDARRKAYKERGALLMRGVDDWDYFLRPTNDFFAEMTMLEYAAKDAEMSMALLGGWLKAKRLAAQRPLIHNGRKYRK